MCANHRSLLDLILTFILLGRWHEPTRCFVNADYFDSPGLGWLLRTTGCIPVASGWADQAIDEGLAVLKAEGNVAIMPEGRLVSVRDRVDGIGEIKTGVGRLAQSADVPVLVVGLAGSDVVWPRGGWPRPRLARPTVAVRVRLLDKVEGSPEQQRDRIASTMRELVGEAEAASAPRR